MQDLTIEEEIFGKLTPVKDSFGPFGFTRKASGWVYRESFLNGAFVAEIHIDDRGHLTGRVIDADLEEDYLPFRVKTDVGDYVASVRQGYADILQKVARACYKSAPFASSQANRIASLILSRYHESPDFPFSTYPDCAVFRFDGTGSWYGLVMPVRFSKISGVPKASPEDDPVADVLNLRVGENRVGEATSHPGFYPAYHMQKKAWVSVVLDGTPDDQTILAYLDISRIFASLRKPSAGRKKKRGLSG